MSSALSPRAWAIFLLAVAAMTLMAGLGLLLAGLVFGALFFSTVTGAVASHGRVVVSIGVLLFAVGIVGMSGVLPCLLLTLAVTTACAMSIPLLPRRGALAH